MLSRALEDGSLARVGRIHGEWHDGRLPDLLAILTPLFNVQSTTTSRGVGTFFAVRLPPTP